MDAAAATARLITAEAMILLILFLLYRECGVCVGDLMGGGGVGALLNLRTRPLTCAERVWPGAQPGTRPVKLPRVQ